jgi:hypothetical protein
MGSDIHWYSETRKGGKWICDQAETFAAEEDTDPNEPVRYDMDDFPGRGRDYWMFGLLAHNRTSWPWSFDEKGMPDDASREVRQLCSDWDGDGHTHSYVTRAELKAKMEEIRMARAHSLIQPELAKFNEGADHFMTRLPEIIGNLNSEVPDEDQRIVFWFDN